jgi:hypothetical protein
MLDEVEGKNNVRSGKYLHGNVLASNLSRYFSRFLRLSRSRWIRAVRNIAAAHVLVARGIFVSRHDDNVAFHRAEPRRPRISIPDTRKDSAYLAQRGAGEGAIA